MKYGEQLNCAQIGKTVVFFDSSFRSVTEIHSSRLPHGFTLRREKIAEFLGKHPKIARAAFEAMGERRNAWKEWREKNRAFRYSADRGVFRMVADGATVLEVHNRCGDVSGRSIFVATGAIDGFAFVLHIGGRVGLCDYDCGDPSPVSFVSSPDVYISTDGRGEVLIVPRG